MCKIWIFGGTTEGRLLAEYCSREKIEAWVSVASEYGEELLQEELMESGNAGNPDLNHNTKESGQCADKEICFAKKSCLKECKRNAERERRIQCKNQLEEKYFWGSMES